MSSLMLDPQPHLAACRKLTMSNEVERGEHVVRKLTLAWKLDSRAAPPPRLTLVSTLPSGRSASRAPLHHFPLPAATPLAAAGRAAEYASSATGMRVTAEAASDGLAAENTAAVCVALSSTAGWTA